MRYVFAVLALLALVGGLVAVKFTQISSLMSMGEKMKEAGPPPETVGTAVSQEQTWGGLVSAVGTIESVKGVAISNEVPGVVSAIRFESGATVKQGQVLVELDSQRRAGAARLARRAGSSRRPTSAARGRSWRTTRSRKAQLDTDERSSRRPAPTSTRCRRRSTARWCARRSPESSASARSTSAST